MITSKIAAMFFLSCLGVNVHITSGFAPLPHSCIARNFLRRCATSRDEEGTIGVDGTVDARTARIFFPLLTIVGNSFLPEVAHAGIGSAIPFEVTRKAYFPGSLTNSVIILRVDSALRKRNYRPTNTVLGTFLCSSDMAAESLAVKSAKKFAAVGTVGVTESPLGCVGGLPIASKKGFETLVSLCPANGKIVVLFGPHVGISKDGEVGKVERIGEDAASADCREVVDAYNAIANNAKGSSDEETYLMDKLRDRVANLASNEQHINNDKIITAVTKEMYAIIRDQLQGEVASLVTTPKFWDNVSELTLLGGIVINRAKGGKNGGESCFQPLMIKTLTATGETDLYGEVFGDLDVPPKDLK